MSMNIYKASQQWSTRPDDERFESLEAMRAASFQYAQDAMESRVPYSSLRVEAAGPEVQLTGRSGYPARLTNWAFGQLCQRIGAPASYLRAMPATLAAQNINYGLAHRSEENADRDDVAQMLFHRNGGLMLRCMMSTVYERIWNWEVIDRLLYLQDRGWKPANQVKEAIATWSQGEAVSAPLYASDHDMFAFLCFDGNPIKEAGSDFPLFRGVIAENSEVGSGALKLTRFAYRWMCGNHIIWSVSKVVEIRVRHVGSVRAKFDSYEAELRKYANEGASLEEARIAHAKQVRLGSTKEEVLDKLFGMRALNMPRRLLEAGYDATVPDQDGDPNTQWGIVQGLTRHSQTVPFADTRTSIDRAAGKIMQFDF